MPRVKAIEARLPVSDVGRSAAFFANTLGFEIGTLSPQPEPEFAILNRDGLRLQLGRDGTKGAGPGAVATLWLDVEELPALHAHVRDHATVEWAPRSTRTGAASSGSGTRMGTG